MATVALNRATQVLRIDLTNPEFAVIDALLTAKGTAPIERALAYLIQQQRQEKDERVKTRLKSYVERVRDGKRDELEAVMNTDPEA